MNLLDGMRNADGPRLQAFRDSVAADGEFEEIAISMEVRRGGRDPVEALATIKEDFLVRLVENLQARFPRTDLLDAMKVFEPASYPADNQALAYWGRAELETLLDHYADQKRRDGNVFEGYVDRHVCVGQFGAFKLQVGVRFRGEHRVDDAGVRYFHKYRPTELLEKMFGGDNVENQEIYGEVYKLMTACLIVLISNAEAERVFSCQNRIKTKSRTLLSIDQLDRLIRISYAKVPMADFDFAAARELYLQAPRRL
ncbi:uncharacterized protein LOC118417829 [Branchiostoma floridae]|uniref:Uncharacterized protein LOC118417829 n=1 Tax=Branchiostoma floridae TaxID=7739 RepID=A0A9J7LCF7_BRAFL|nr:uncharacterized protein LOC118417829 [Branchiostoma floridae]